jgi:hypothetical protein
LDIKDDVAWVAVRRIVRHRKSPGFANARALEMGYLEWRKRAYNSRDRSKREIVVEDVIGKEPNIETNRALADVFADLDKLVGQDKVKAAFWSILKFAQSNYKAELSGEQVRPMSMNRMFLGNPGTGKVRSPPFFSLSISLLIPSPTHISKEHGRLVCCAQS